MKKILFISLISIGMLSLFSCVTATSGVPEKIDFKVNLTGEDFVTGPVVTGKAKFNIDYVDDYSLALDAAKSLAKFYALETVDEYDFILFPRYKIEYIAGGSPVVTVVGRAARMISR